jgi:hypothetical protein
MKKEIIIIWIILIASLLFAISTNQSKTKIILEANAYEDYSSDIGIRFGDKLRETQLNMEVVYNRIEAVRQCEGWYKKGSIAQRTNNQGNFKAGGKTDSQGHTIFEAPIHSYQFMLKYFYNRQDQTLYQISRYYASASNQWYYCVTHSL